MSTDRVVPEPEPRTIPGTAITYTIGSLVRYLHKGLPMVAVVGEIYTHLDPVRFDGVRQDMPSAYLDRTGTWVEIDMNDSIWAYESDIIAVMQY